MNRKTLIIIGILTVVLAFMDISGMPCVLFANFEISNITPLYCALMLNFVVMGIVAFLTLKYLCPDWKLGFTGNGFTSGLKKYGAVGVAVGIISGFAFFIGLQPFDYKPTILKVLIEGIVYYAGVAIIEELYIRGLLLNLIEKIFGKCSNPTAIAVIASSVIFGLGHVFGVMGEHALLIITKVAWTIAMGIYFGAIYKKTNNLWLPIVLHFIINTCALPYFFTTTPYFVYPDISLYIILPAFLLLGAYGLLILKNDR